MNPTQALTTPQAFFFAHAGYCYDPATETREQGRTRCAQNLAAAEALAREAGACFHWETDRDSPGEWVCIGYDSAGRVFAALGGVDFGDGVGPWGQDYRRVIEAELALELVNETLQAAQH